ncbi:MAG TPA: protein translocase subunit SecF [Candidatus Paceibacterota bacterium]
MFIIKYKKYFLVLSSLLVIASVVLVLTLGLKPAIDFTGGSLIELEMKTLVTEADVLSTKQKAEELLSAPALVQPVGENGILIRTRTLTQGEHEKLLTSFGDVDEKRFDSIGPVIGKELRTKSFWAIGLVIVLIVLYITFAFRKVSKPVSSWKYGLIAVVTLVHDVIVPAGFFALWGYYTGAQMDVLFITAILAILGFSIHDTIVVFDRIRENLRLSGGKESFAIIVGQSLSQTFTRSINTSLTVVLTLLALMLFGGASTKDFALVLLVGIVAGTYSSIFVASPLLVVAESLQKK